MSLVNAARLQKMVLAKRIGQFLSNDHEAEERQAVENVARMLAQDVSRHVREVLAFELRRCSALSPDLAEQIACDVEAVSGPFLAQATCFSDEQLAEIIPRLEERARIILARRADLGKKSSMAIVNIGDERSVTYLVRNDRLELDEEAASGVLTRFEDNRRLMDHLSARVDLPLMLVEGLIDKVSEHCRRAMIEHYDVDLEVAETVTADSREEALWSKLEHATRSQVHGYVVDLRREGRLTNDLVIDMTERGSLFFLESALALASELTVVEVREALSMERKDDFMRLMKRANIGKEDGMRFIKLAKKHYAKD